MNIDDCVWRIFDTMMMLSKNWGNKEIIGRYLSQSASGKWDNKDSSIRYMSWWRGQIQRHTVMRNMGKDGGGDVDS